MAGELGADVAVLPGFVGHELGLAANTLVVFTSDNGGHPVYSANGPLRGSKWNLHEGGIRVPWIVRFPGRVPAGAVSDVPFIGTDLLPTLAAATGAQVPTAEAAAAAALAAGLSSTLWRFFSASV